jgi:hypothetical protein
LTTLLIFYDFKSYYAWEEYDENGERVSKTYEQLAITSKTKEQFYVERSPIKAHCSLATILGLDYAAVAEEMDKLEKFQQEQHTTLPAKK